MTERPLMPGAQRYHVRSVAIRLCALAAASLLVISGCRQASRHRRAFPADPGRQCEVGKETDAPATMRDGTVLRADVYRPRTTDPVPVILMRTQYGKSGAQAGSRYQTPDWFASHCYLVVIQDVRGQGASAGTFSEYTNDMSDGYDSVEWAAALPGSNGKVGIRLVVRRGNPAAAATTASHLATIVPANTARTTTTGGHTRAGVPAAFVQPWAIGLRPRPPRIAAIKPPHQSRLLALTRLGGGLPPVQTCRRCTAESRRHRAGLPPGDDLAAVQHQDRYPSVKVPVFHFEGWYDVPRRRHQNFTGMVAPAAPSSPATTSASL
jgi:predicted acyl esterase